MQWRELDDCVDDGADRKMHVGCWSRLEPAVLAAWIYIVTHRTGYFSEGLCIAPQYTVAPPCQFFTERGLAKRSNW